MLLLYGGESTGSRVEKEHGLSIYSFDSSVYQEYAWVIGWAVCLINSRICWQPADECGLSSSDNMEISWHERGGY